MPETEQPELARLTVELLSAYVANNSVPSDALAALIESTRAALAGEGTAKAAALAEAEAKALEYTPAVSIEKSLASRDHILSLIDGKPYKALKRHLANNGLTPGEYRARYKLPADYPLVAPSYSEKRRNVAKASGLGGRRPAATATAAPAPKTGAAKPSPAPKAAVAVPAPEAAAAKPVSPKEPAKAGKSAAKAKPASAKSAAKSVAAPVTNAAPVTPPAAAETDAGKVSAKPEAKTKSTGKTTAKSAGRRMARPATSAAQAVPSEPGAASAPAAAKSRKKLGIKVPSVEAETASAQQPKAQAAKASTAKSAVKPSAAKARPAKGNAAKPAAAKGKTEPKAPADTAPVTAPADEVKKPIAG